MKKNNKKGFTIVELVIVIAVIAILSAVLIPTFSNITNKAKESAALQKATNAMTEYLADNSDNVTEQKELLIDAGDYVVYVNLENEKTVQKETTYKTVYTKFTASNLTDEDNNLETENTYTVKSDAIVCKLENNVYEKINANTQLTAEDLAVDGVEYYTITPATITGYTYYGTFEGCEVYTKNVA